MAHHLYSLSPVQALFPVLSQNILLSTFRTLSHHQTRALRPKSQVRQVMLMRPRVSVSNNLPRTVVDQLPDVNRDEAIAARYVRILLAGGDLAPAEPLRSALSRLDQSREHLVQVSKVDENNIAVCRIMTIADLNKQKRDKEKMQKEQKKALKLSVPKQIELNWAIGSNDLAHKLAQLKSFIADGKKVEIVLASKRRQRQATPEEGSEVLRKVREAIEEANGRELKAMQGGEVGKHTTLTVRRKGLE